MQRQTLSVTGMSCDGCEGTVESALRNVEGVSQVDADHETDSVDVVVEETVSVDTLEETIRDAGYDVTA
jgi:copper chaperone